MNSAAPPADMGCPASSITPEAAAPAPPAVPQQAQGDPELRRRVAPRASIFAERRAGRRVAAEDTPWPRAALLRPGQEVSIINLGPGGTLVESSNRMLPGTRAELHLLGPARLIVRGRIERCRVIRLEPLIYEGAVAFETPLDKNLLGSE